MAAAPYIPPKNANLLAWSLNFTTLLTASPATYGLLTTDATTCASQYTALAAAFALITSPSTKTAATVQAFNIAKVTALGILRPYAQTIANNAGVLAANKIAIGVNARTTPPTPVPAPLTYPILGTGATSQAGTILTYYDSAQSSTVKAKPAGVVQVQLFAMTSITAITNPDLLPYLMSVTTTPILAALGSGAAGKIAYFAARYITRKGMVSPWSPVVNCVVAG